MEHIEQIRSLESKLFSVYIEFIRKRSGKCDILRYKLQQSETDQHVEQKQGDIVKTTSIKSNHDYDPNNPNESNVESNQIYTFHEHKINAIS